MSILNNTDFPIDPATTSGSDLAARLNRLANAFLTTNGNVTRPNTIQADGLWVRQNVDGSRDLMMYTGTSDVIIKSISAAGATEAFRSNLDLKSITGNLTLNNTHIENQLIATGTTNNVTLPLAGSVLAGTGIRLVNIASGLTNLLAQGTDQIDFQGTLSASLAIGSGDDVEIVSDGTNWRVVGGSAALAKSKGVFASGSNWLVTPSKKLIQWGSGTSNAGGVAVITLPTAYLNTSYSVLTSRFVAAVGAAAFVAMPYNFNVGSFNVNTVRCDSNAQQTASFFWETIGDAP